jgi:hydroxyacylglutathione hydrolase
MIPLEDNYDDVLGKAQRGLGVSAAELAARTGLNEAAIRAVMAGQFEEPVARAVAEALGLDAERLVRLGRREYAPAPVPPIDGLIAFNTPFDDMRVNAYLVWDPASKEAAVFDTGSDAGGILDAAAARDLTVRMILLTHAHGDHIFDLDRLREKTGAEAWIGEGERLEGVNAFSPGREFRVGALSIGTRLTWGHSRGGITYVVGGLSVPVAVMGDAMFAGSMGGGMISYEAALRTNRDEILTLPDETVLCPGHGPVTTVGEQKAVNPFFPMGNG